MDGETDSMILMEIITLVLRETSLAAGDVDDLNGEGRDNIGAPISPGPRGERVFVAPRREVERQEI